MEDVSLEQVNMAITGQINMERREGKAGRGLERAGSRGSDYISEFSA